MNSVLQLAGRPFAGVHGFIAKLLWIACSRKSAQRQLLEKRKEDVWQLLSGMMQSTTTGRAAAGLILGTMACNGFLDDRLDSVETALRGYDAVISSVEPDVDDFASKLVKSARALGSIAASLSALVAGSGCARLPVTVNMLLWATSASKPKAQQLQAAGITSALVQVAEDSEVSEQCRTIAGDLLMIAMLPEGGNTLDPLPMPTDCRMLAEEERLLRSLVSNKVSKSLPTLQSKARGHESHLMAFADRSTPLQEGLAISNQNSSVFREVGEALLQYEDSTTRAVTIVSQASDALRELARDVGVAGRAAGAVEVDLSQLRDTDKELLQLQAELEETSEGVRAREVAVAEKQKSIKSLKAKMTDLVAKKDKAEAKKNETEKELAELGELALGDIVQRRQETEETLKAKERKVNGLTLQGKEDEADAMKREVKQLRAQLRKLSVDPGELAENLAKAEAAFAVRDKAFNDVVEEYTRVTSTLREEEAVLTEAQRSFQELLPAQNSLTQRLNTRSAEKAARWQQVEPQLRQGRSMTREQLDRLVAVEQGEARIRGQLGSIGSAFASEAQLRDLLKQRLLVLQSHITTAIDQLENRCNDPLPEGLDVPEDFAPPPRAPAAAAPAAPDPNPLAPAGGADDEFE